MSWMTEFLVIFFAILASVLAIAALGALSFGLKWAFTKLADKKEKENPK